MRCTYKKNEHRSAVLQASGRRLQTVRRTMLPLYEQATVAEPCCLYPIDWRNRQRVRVWFFFTDGRWSAAALPCTGAVTEKPVPGARTGSSDSSASFEGIGSALPRIAHRHFRTAPSPGPWDVQSGKTVGSMMNRPFLSRKDRGSEPSAGGSARAAAISV